MILEAAINRSTSQDFGEAKGAGFLTSMNSQTADRAWNGSAWPKTSWWHVTSRLLHRCVEDLGIGNAGNLVIVPPATIKHHAVVMPDAVAATAFAH